MKASVERKGGEASSHLRLPGPVWVARLRRLGASAHQVHNVANRHRALDQADRLGGGEWQPFP
jgi:hypothetical protein